MRERPAELPAAVAKLAGHLHGMVSDAGAFPALKAFVHFVTGPAALSHADGPMMIADRRAFTLHPLVEAGVFEPGENALSCSVGGVEYFAGQHILTPMTLAAPGS